MKWRLNILLSSLLSCLSGAICAVPVGRVGSRGGLQALRVLHPWTHAHIINIWMCACPPSLVCWGARPTENRHQSQGRFFWKRNEELSSLSTHTSTDSTHTACVSTSLKSWKAQDLRLAQRFFLQKEEILIIKEDLQKRTSEQSQSAVNSIKARSLEASTAGTKLLVLKTDKLTN